MLLTYEYARSPGLAMSILRLFSQIHLNPLFYPDGLYLPGTLAHAETEDSSTAIVIIKTEAHH